MIKFASAVAASFFGFAALASLDANAASIDDALLANACHMGYGKEINRVVKYKSPKKGITFYTFRAVGCGGSFNSSQDYVGAVKNGKVIDSIGVDNTHSIPLGIDPKGGGRVTKAYFYPANDECFGGMFQVEGNTPGYGGKYYPGKIAAYYLDGNKLVQHIGGC